MPPARLVVVGASNVARGYRTLTGLLRSRISTPLDLRFALGHGRSYHDFTTLGVRGIPGILACDLWKSLEKWTTGPRPAALVTDIGNDLMYEVPIPKLLGWVDDVVRRFQDLNAEVVLTRPPYERAKALKNWQYVFVRSVMFPGLKMSLEEMRRRLDEMDAGVKEIASRTGVTFIEPPPSWYGFDPIHIRCGAMIEAWSTILSGFKETLPFDESKPWPAACRLQSWRKAKPKAYRMFGRERSAEQPLICTDELTVSFY